MRLALAFLFALIAGPVSSSGALAHASLVRADPPDGAMLASSPAVLKLTFNEPVSPLVMRLIGPDGAVIAPAAAAENNVVTLTPPQLRQGTHVLSWRVVSADGHPVGGSLLFSIGVRTEPVERTEVTVNPALRVALWAAKVAIYIGLFVGVGGAFFGAWLGSADRGRTRWLLLAFLVPGLIATPISLGLQGLDALDLPLSAIGQATAWQTGQATAYGGTAVMAELALIAGSVALAVNSWSIARGASLLGLLGVGLALSLSGHAGTVEPRLLTRSAVFLHGVSVAFWIGALLPLVCALRAGDRGPIARFSRLIPLALAVLVGTGTILAVVQLDRIDALWTTRYGVVLAFKLCAIALLLALAAVNRFVLTSRFAAQGAAAAPPFVASVRTEFALALGILALVGLWRFTPPPRALAVAEHTSIHVHGERAMAQIEITPVRARGASVSVLLLDPELRPLAAKELTLAFANPAVGIEPVRRNAAFDGDANWRIEDVRIPIGGRWRLRLDILVSDYEKLILEDEVELRRVP